MSLLASRFRSSVSKSKDMKMKLEATGDMCYSTGFVAFDFLNGYIVHVKNEEKDLNYKYYNVGIQDGTLTMFIGRSQCGKTTFAMQCGFNIIKDYPTASFFHDDCENSVNNARKRVLTGTSIQELRKRYICRDTGVTTETFYERIKMISDEKLNNYDDYSYDTGLLDEDGSPIIKLEPTVYLLDSFPMLMPEKYATEDELSGQMAAPAIARGNTQMLKRIIPMLKASNIMLFIINHILPDVSLTPRKSQLRCLKNTERITGGETLIYLTSNTVRFDDVRVKEQDNYGIEGAAIINVSLAKSRQNQTGKAVPLFFDPAIGYDPDMSLFLLLKNNDMIKGQGIGLRVGDDDQYKFSKKTFKEKLNDEDDGFRNVVMDAVSGILRKMVVDNETDKVLNRNEKISTGIMQKMNQLLV